MANFLTTKQTSPLRGEVVVPADKSISHRSLILGALTRGKLKITNFLTSEDCKRTLEIIKAVGGIVEFEGENTLYLDATKCFQAPSCVLDCGNSGTTMRLISGLFASQNFEVELIGDPSLSKRPMKRIIEPLEAMGASISSNGFKAPLKISGGNLKSIEYESKIASAQVKSCLIIASLMSGNSLTYYEPTLSRNHTELMLEYFGAKIKTQKLNSKVKIEITPSNLEAKDIEVAGDISSATFYMIMALIVPNSEILLKNVGINQTRSGVIDVLVDMGADIQILNKRVVSNEEVGDILVKYSGNLSATTISGDIIPRLIDELPALALLLTQANGESVVADASDLRNKESDRIKEIVNSLSQIGANIEETKDGFKIIGKSELQGGAKLKTNLDHRLAMTYFMAGLISKNPIEIEDFDCHKTSFPQFLEIFESLKK